MIVTGGYGCAFISDFFAQTHNLPSTSLPSCIDLENFDGRPVVSRNMTYKTILDLYIGMHCKHIRLFVTRLGYYLIVLEIAWLQRHDPLVKFSANSSSIISSSLSDGHRPGMLSRGQER